MTRPTRQQVIDGYSCPQCGAPRGEPCKAATGGHRHSVHLVRFPGRKRPSRKPAAAKQSRNDSRPEKSPSLNRFRDKVRDATICPRCAAKRGDYCITRSGKFRLELHAVRWRSHDALPPPTPQTATPPNS